MRPCDAGVTMPRTAALPEPILPAQVRYIKLGRAGAWQQRSIDEGRIYWGLPTDPVAEAARGDWPAVRENFEQQYSAPSAVTGAIREMREFFDLGSDTLWLSFFGGQMWWAFSGPAQAVPGPVPPGAPAAFRTTLGGWHNRDIHGNLLVQSRLSTRLTQVAAYRRTICNVEHAAYAVRRINGEEEAGVALVREHRQSLAAAVTGLIRALHWRDFELLVDLIFTGAGWRRISELGGSQAELDLVLQQPITGEVIAVQVKSRLDQAAAEACISRFENAPAGNRYFLIHHTGEVSPGARAAAPWLHLWDCEVLADRAIDAGLTGWLADRAG